MKARRDMPAYASTSEYSVVLTQDQFRVLLKRKEPWFPSLHGSDVVRVAQLRDGTYWAEWRGDMLFWASRWFQIPKAAGDRIFDFDLGVQALLENEGDSRIMVV